MQAAMLRSPAARALRAPLQVTTRGMAKKHAPSPYCDSRTILWKYAGDKRSCNNGQITRALSPHNQDLTKLFWRDSAKKAGATIAEGAKDWVYGLVFLVGIVTWADADFADRALHHRD